MALIRLEDGTHVRPRADGQPPVRSAVCSSQAARGFLQSLGLTEPDPVDDVIRNIIPKYREHEVHVSMREYRADIRRMLGALATDSKAQRKKLIGALSEARFVMSVDAGDGSKRVTVPGEVYLATERLKELFAGARGVLLVDDS